MEDLFKIEFSAKEQFKNDIEFNLALARQNVDEIKKQIYLIPEISKVFENNVKIVTDLMGAVDGIDLSFEFFLNWTRSVNFVENKKSMEQKGDEYCRRYVSNLFNVNIDAVDSMVIPFEKWNLSCEAFQETCGLNESYIVLPSNWDSVDRLYVHEFAHSAHSIVLRSKSGYERLFAHQFTSEFVAFFSEFNFLCKHGLKDDLVYAVGPVFEGMFHWYVYKFLCSGGQGKFCEFKSTEYGKKMINFFGEEKCIERYEEIKDANHLYKPIIYALSIIAGINNMENIDGVREFINLDCYDEECFTRFNKIFPNSFDIGNFERKILSIVSG